MKSKRRMPFIIIGVLVLCLVCLGGALAARDLMASYGASTTIKLVNTLIWLLPGQPASSTPTSMAIAITPNLSEVGTAVVPTAAPPTSLQACNNVLYPLRTGQHWVYRVTARGASYNVDMTVPSVSGQQAMVNLFNQATKMSSQVAVDCDNGVIRNFPWMAAGMIFDQDIKGTMTAQYISGILAPSQSTFASNNWNLTWSGVYKLTGTGTVEFQGNAYSLSVNQAPLQITCRTTGSGAAAFEPITVAAGHFNSALKVLCSFQTQAALKMNGQSLIGNVSGNTTLWFAPDIGLLKMQADSANIQYLIFNVPMNVAGSVELVQYLPAP